MSWTFLTVLTTVSPCLLPQRQYYTANDNLNTWKETSRINSYSFFSMQILFLTQHGWSQVAVRKAFISTLWRTPAPEGRCKSRGQRAREPPTCKRYQWPPQEYVHPLPSKVPLWPSQTMLMLSLRPLISKKAIRADSSGTPVLSQACPICSAGMHTY